jgi:hypothetical protein
MMFYDPVTNQWYPTSSSPSGLIPILAGMTDGLGNALVDALGNMLVGGIILTTRLTVTILADGSKDGGTRRAECQQAAEMLARIAEQLTNTQGLSGTIVDRNGVATATYVYTPTAPS